VSARIPEPGQLLADRYRIVRLIGAGGMGAVLEAENTLTGKRVAIKLMQPELGHNSEAAQRLVREAQASCRIRHQNVVDVYDVVREGDALFLVMELLEGEPLSALLERGGVPAFEFIAIVLQAMRGVAAAHRAGVIHRDIHPGNILLAREPPSEIAVPKVLDFGIAKIRDQHEQALTGSGVTMGTPLYMSYEQLCSARDIDARTDVYPFGVILYQGLTGKPPFEAQALTELLVKLATEAPRPAKQLTPELPTALDRLISWALERDRDKRIASMDAFIDELEPFASARAFHTQMTDAQRTLPALVPRGQEARPRPPRPLEPAPLESVPPPAATPTRLKTLHEVSVRSAPAAASLPAPVRRNASQMVPMVLVAASALAVMGLGTVVVRRCSAPAEPEARIPAPPPLPLIDAGLRAAGRGARAAGSGAAGSAPVSASAPIGADASVSLAAPVAPARAIKAKRAVPAPKRRFRAGEARQQDF
jgi:serine/threonine-protein kinase